MALNFSLESPPFNVEYERDVRIYLTASLYNDSLTVKKTSIDGCDFLGLFAKTAFKQGEIVCVYTGDRLRTAKAIKLDDKSYLMRLGEQSYVDAMHCTNVVARYINDCINPVGWNVVFEKYSDGGFALVRSLRYIECSEELFVSYGKRYWLLQKPVALSTAKLLPTVLAATAAEDQG
mmetsp:Transcript_9829/g.16468  ORF Transcript_9829/g.16468 Transcript_9829/m.16468 type:complete len:177 (+) Transcript_9829:45-575(+)